MRERRGPTLRGPENLQDQNLEIRKRGRCDQRKPRNSLKKPRKTQEEGGLDTIEREDFKQDRVANCVESKKMLSKLLNLSQKLCVCAQLRPTFCSSIDCGLPGSSVLARIPEQDYLSYPGDLPNPGIKPMSFASPALVGRFFTTVPPGKPLLTSKIYKIGIILLIPSACSENLVK